MNHFEFQAAILREANIRVLRSERESESKKLDQLKIRLEAANTKKSVTRAA
jgi:hypothetical protein